MPNLYRRSDVVEGAGPFELLTACPACGGTPISPVTTTGSARYFLPAIAGASSDLQTLIFESRQSLTADTPESPGCDPTTSEGSHLCRIHLYESTDNTVNLAGRVPQPPATFCSDQTGPACVPADISNAGQSTHVGPDLPNRVPGSLSDGSDGHIRVFITQPTDSDGHTSEETGNPPPQGAEQGRLFMRVDGKETFAINASERPGGGIPSNPAKFWGASRDGEKAFFTSTAALTDDAPDNGSEKLYMYSVQSAPGGTHLTLLSQRSSVESGPISVIGNSDDGSYVYFMQPGQQVAGEPSRFLEANVGVFLWHNGVVSYISSITDGTVGENSRLLDAPPMARVTPDGTHLLFSSAAGEGKLGSYGAAADFDQGTADASCFTSSLGTGCRELYLYDATTNTLSCASCPPERKTQLPEIQGIDPLSLEKLMPSTSVMQEEMHRGAAAGGWHENNSLSTDGRFVFFSTGESLVPEDTNGQVDVYVFDADTGQPRLISGHSKKPSHFLDASPDGSNVFFTTSERLSGWDIDTSDDLYDARIDGGFPEPRPGTAPCNGDSCREAAPPSPQPVTPGSATFAGVSNRVAPKCRKGRHRIAGRTRCVASSRHHNKHRHQGGTRASGGSK